MKQFVDVKKGARHEEVGVNPLELHSPSFLGIVQVAKLAVLFGGVWVVKVGPALDGVPLQSVGSAKIC